MSRFLTPWRTVVLSLAIGCGTEPTPEPPAAPTETPAASIVIAVVDGDGQMGLIGHPLAQPLRLMVTRDGKPVPDVAVVWSARGGTIVGGASGADGIATASWTLPSSPGPVLATARTADSGVQAVMFGATASFPDLRIVDGDGQTDTVGHDLPAPLRVSVTWNGAPIAGQHVRWSAGTVSPDSGVSDTNGIATAIWHLGSKAGTQFMDASFDGTSAPRVRFTATALPVPFAHMRWGDWVTTELSGEYAAVPVVAEDEFGNSVEGVSVAWKLVGGSGTVEPLSVSANSFLGQNYPDWSWAKVTPAAGDPADLTVEASAPGMATISTVVRWVDFLFARGYFWDDYWGPAAIQVPAGTVVRWGNQQSLEHHLAPEGHSELTSAFTGPGRIFEHRFDTPGTFVWYCPDHPGLDGGFPERFTVVVTP